MSQLFELRAPLSRRNRVLLEIGGFFTLILIWALVTSSQIISPTLLPSPLAVLKSFYTLHFDNALVRTLGYSLFLNVAGYVEAIAISLPLGFAIGLLPFLNGILSRYLEAIRFLPIVALTGLFIAWFGIGIDMKIHFLSFGIIVYLLPTVVMRVRELDFVYQHTAFTLGATKWQMFRTVFIPGVLPQLSGDIRVLTAISWTYIITAELQNREGGIGTLLDIAFRQSRVDKAFALLVVIIIVGILQDKVLVFLDKKLFPHKYQGDGSK